MAHESWAKGRDHVVAVSDLVQCELRSINKCSVCNRAKQRLPQPGGAEKLSISNPPDFGAPVHDTGSVIVSG
jgi:hypothetical protein